MNESVVYAVGKELGEAVSAVQVALSDKKVNLSEGIDIAKELGTLGFVAVKNHEALGATFKDGLNATEAADLKAGFEDGYEVESATEQTVEAAFGAAVTIINGIAGLFIDNDTD